ncbi:MAG: rRNA maturation RNase YbeY [Methylococcales bacterium]|jgi:probable rRNA maturation factor|nr:rRNA maturation RNase YbeY [Methylococcales bacterium]MEE2766590.1 rRNA maturation RNase YbeY [Pseudomonadota bacterium]
MNSVEIQRVFEISSVPASTRMSEWASAVMADRVEDSELVIRVVGIEESSALNQQYRKKKGPTNVLSFSYEKSDTVPLETFGDLVICASVVEKEAAEQKKSLDAHWAHMIVHGVLHLLGYDHIEEADALEMEALEQAILGGMGFPNPYREVLEQ